MNKLFRALLILLAVVLCAMPLVACDKPDENPDESDALTNGESGATTNGETDAVTNGEVDNTPKVPGVPTDIPEDSFADKEIVRLPSTDEKYYMVFSQLTAPVDDMVGVSLCYYAADGTLLDSVEFYYQNGGRDCAFADLDEVYWVSDGSAIAILNDAAKTRFTLKDNR